MRPFGARWTLSHLTGGRRSRTRLPPATLICPLRGNADWHAFRALSHAPKSYGLCQGLTAGARTLAGGAAVRRCHRASALGIGFPGRTQPSIPEAQGSTRSTTVRVRGSTHEGVPSAAFGKIRQSTRATIVRELHPVSGLQVPIHTELKLAWQPRRRPDDLPRGAGGNEFVEDESRGVANLADQEPPVCSVCQKERRQVRAIL